MPLDGYVKRPWELPRGKQFRDPQIGGVTVVPARGHDSHERQFAGDFSAACTDA